MKVKRTKQEAFMVTVDQTKIEIPAKNEVYPFGSMEVGQSFFVQTEDTKKFASLRNSATSRGKKLGMKFVTRQMDGGIRVWRVA